MTPILAHDYGIRPWEIELLTMGEIDALSADIKQRAKNAKNQAKGRR